MKKFGAILILLLEIHAQPSCCYAQSPPAGQVIWWGRDCFWKSFDPHHTNGLIENNNEFLTNVVAVAGSQWQGLALKNDGTVFGFGNNIFGGNEVPVGLSNVISIAVAGNSCWAIRSDGTVARWGNENSDQDDANIVAGLSNITAVVWGGNHNYLALQKDGTMLGMSLDGSDSPVVNPATGLPMPDPCRVRLVKVNGEILSNIVALASMGMTPLVLKRDGTVVSLGYQTPGNPPTQPRYEVHENVMYVHLGGESAQLPYRYTSADPVKIDGQILNNVVALASGASHNLALKRDGTVVAWGNETYGATLVPAGLCNVIVIAAAEHESLALKRDGTVVAWGANYAGQTSVPAGLSNVVAIASAMDFNLAVTTGSVPTSIHIQPHGRLEAMTAAADLVFKGCVISTRAETNTAFPEWGKPYASEFKVISVLKGSPQTDVVVLHHITHGPNDWSGGSPPQNFHFEAGRSYLIFAVKADRPDYLYSPSSNNVARPNEFRQPMQGEIANRTLDARRVDGLSVKDACWLELNLLLIDLNPTNQIYAVDKLDSLSLAGRSNDMWSRSADFKRRNVLSALLPLVTTSNELVASRVIGCYAVESNTAVMLAPFAATLIKVATNGTTPNLRLSAIASLSGEDFEAISNSLTQLLHNPSGKIRSQAIELLGLFPGDFAERTLQVLASDDSAKVRAGVADVIGNKKLESLLPTLTKLFTEDGRHPQPITPLTIDELEGGGHIVGLEGGTTMVNDPNYPGANVGDVHTSAGYALLKFDVGQVEEILKTNLDDPGFRLQFVLKLAENNPTPWINDLVQIMEARRTRSIQKTKADGAPPETYIYLSGAYYRCWNMVYGCLKSLPASAFSDGSLNQCLDMLENAGSTGSQEPTQLYALYRLKGLEKRATEFRSKCEKSFAYDMKVYFNRVDNQFSNSPNSL